MTVVDSPPAPSKVPPQIPPTTPRRPIAASDLPRLARRSRFGLVLIMIVSLIGAGFCRQWASAEQHANVQIGQGAGGAPLSRMNSFALGLLLGGLRGPLVMLLWTTSESQKQDKDLDDFDTKVEWIRLLQPEFDTVHIFQIWNKAYNISVLKASLNNKYLTILDALDYAKKVNRERPDDINIVYAIGGVYFDKLGQSSEKIYYTHRVRTETLPHPPHQKLSRDDPAWRPLELDPMLDEQGYLRPELLAKTRTHLVDPADPSEMYDGSELQFLAQYQPFPDGLSPLALGYNYQKRAALLQSLAHERHAQLSDSVVDSRAPLTLEFWATEELERGRRLELAGFATPIPTERLDMESPKDEPAGGISDPARRAILQHAQREYTLTSRVATDSLHEYEKHVLHYRSNLNTSVSHMEGVDAQSSLAAGDRDYIAALLTSGEDRRKLLTDAAGEYRKSAYQYELYLFRYYLNDDDAKKIFPKGYDRATIQSLDPRNFDSILEGYKRVTFLPGGVHTEFSEDADEFVRYVSRAQTRMSQIQAQLKS